MKLNKLYKRRSDGGVQEWEIEVSSGRFRVTSGIKDGSLVTSEWTICEGKNLGRSNETTPIAQAQAEAQAKWQKQYDKGYREEVGEVDNLTQFKPMLAKIWGDYKEKTSFPVYSQRKYNGMRSVSRADGMWSRGGKPISAAPHIFEVLKPLFDKYPGLVIDGELYNHELCDLLNQLLSLVKKQKPSSSELTESKKIVRYYVYDAAGLPGLNEDAGFGKRHEVLSKIINDLGSEYIVFVDTEKVISEKQLDALYKQYLAEGYEGQMVRLDAPYQNKRTSDLLKRKEFQDAEFPIVQIVEGIGNRSGMAGAVECRLPDGQTFRANIKGDRAFLRDLLRDKLDYTGKSATVKFFDYTEYGIPYFPVVTAFDRESAGDA
jgi:DNA ligase-1